VRWFSLGLSALWAKAEALAKKNSDDLGAIDFDAATNSQCMQVKSFRVETLSRDSRRAVVAATLVSPTTGCANRSARTQFATIRSGRAAIGRSTAFMASSSRRRGRSDKS
jgi:hypothetical protein